MPRRNLLVLILVGLLSALCHYRLQKSQYGRLLVDVMDQVHRRALEPVPGQRLFEGALEGMLEQLDEYSAYIAPKALPEFQQTIDQQYGGVGMEVTLDPKTKRLVVISPLVGTPAHEAGVRAGDQILRIDGVSTEGLSLKDAVAKMQGRPGDPVTITVLHEGEQKPVEITVVRARIQVDTVLGDTHDPSGAWRFTLAEHPEMGYLRVTAFGERTAQEVTAAIDQLVAKPVKGLILDLRNDPGGLLDQTVQVCNQFIDQGVIVTTRNRGGRIRRLYKANGEGRFLRIPLAVIVNRFTASAAEILAACLQDHERAVIVGQRTWGKGTVQEVIDLGEGLGAVKLTTASYWRPNGKNIHRTKNATEDDDWGVLPDKGYEVSSTPEEQTRWMRWRLERDGRKLPAEKPEHPPASDKKKNSGGAAAKSYVDREVVKAVEYLEQAAVGRK